MWNEEPGMFVHAVNVEQRSYVLPGIRNGDLHPERLKFSEIWFLEHDWKMLGLFWKKR